MAKRFYKESELVFIQKPKNPKFQDLEGQKIGGLSVIGFAGINKEHVQWFCKCDCGNILKVQRGNLKSGATKSCGCLMIKRTKEANTTHGHSRKGQRSKTYNTWKSMLDRCQIPTYRRFKNYGGRGITVCDRWKKFDNFLADMGEKPEGLSIDRIDNNGNYCPENCRWATIVEQNNNTRSNHLLTHNGKTQNVTQWGHELGIKREIIYNRLMKLGWPVEQALTTPVVQRKRML